MKSVFSYCCPVSHVVNAYCLSDFLSYCILCVDPVFTLCHRNAPFRGHFASLHTFYHTRGMQNDVGSCFLPSPLSLPLIFWSFFCAIDPHHHHHPRLNSILNYMINLVFLQSSAVFYYICDTPLSLFLNTRCRQ